MYIYGLTCIYIYIYIYVERSAYFICSIVVGAWTFLKMLQFKKNILPVSVKVKLKVLKKRLFLYSAGPFYGIMRTGCILILKENLI